MQERRRRADNSIRETITKSAQQLKTKDNFFLFQWRNRMRKQRFNARHTNTPGIFDESDYIYSKIDPPHAWINSMLSMVPTSGQRNHRDQLSSVPDGTGTSANLLHPFLSKFRICFHERSALSSFGRRKLFPIDDLGPPHSLTIFNKTQFPLTEHTIFNWYTSS